MALFSIPSRNSKLLYKLGFGFIHLKCISYKLKGFTWSRLWSAYSEHTVVYVTLDTIQNISQHVGLGKKMTMQPFNMTLELL